MNEEAELFLIKARESLAGATSEAANRRFNNSANRCYYATFQEAISALMRANIYPRGARLEWGHDFVQAQFNGELVNRRKLYSPELREVFERSYSLRVVADYQGQQVSQTQVMRALRRVEAFVEAVELGGVV